MLLEGKTVLITGASRGIGRATAVECARHGADVAINSYNDDAAARLVVAEIEALGRRAVALDGDVALPETATSFVDQATEALGRVDVFVSNAGICPFHAFLDMPAETLRRTMDVNLTGAWFMTQAAANQMVKQGGGGAIVAVSSISALVGGAMQTHYTPTKAGVHSLMQSCAVALGQHGIRCNSVMPGTIETDINRDDLSDPCKRAYMEGRIPLGRLGRPEDVARVIVFLASDMAAYVTGAAILTDGGAFANFQ
jgi:L-rhamnose 1-dehydrogenase